MSNRMPEQARDKLQTADGFFFGLGNGAATPDWMAGGAFGDVVGQLGKEGHVPAPHLVSAFRLLSDMRSAHGTSAGIVPQYGERVQTSIRARQHPPGGGNPDAFARMSRLLASLRAHERALLAWLIIHRELPRGELSDLGRMASGYRTSKTTRAHTVGRISGLLASIAELYG